MKFALRAPILKYTLFGMLFLNSPAQASEPRSKRMEKTASDCGGQRSDPQRLG